VDQNKIDRDLVKYQIGVDIYFNSLKGRLVVWTNSITGIIIAQISFEEILFNFFEGGDSCTLLGQCHTRSSLSCYPLKGLIHIRRLVD
jgi:hypothetical protein